MAIHVTLLDEAGHPFATGLGVELLRDGQAIETAFTAEGGAVVFAADPAGPYNLRMLAPDALVTPRGPAARADVRATPLATPGGEIRVPIEIRAPAATVAPAAIAVTPAAVAARTAPVVPAAAPPVPSVPARDPVSDLLTLVRTMAWATARAAIEGASSELALRTTRDALSSSLARPEERAALRAVGADLAARVRALAARSVPGGAEERLLTAAAVAAALLSAEAIDAAAKEQDLLPWAVALAPWLEEAAARGAFDARLPPAG